MLEDLKRIRRDLRYAYDKDDRLLVGFALNRLDNYLYNADKNLKKEKVKELLEDYDSRAHSGHFAGEEPSYHYRSGFVQAIKIVDENN